MLIHTFEISTITTSDLYFNTQNQLKQTGNDWSKKGDHKMVYFGLRNHGIIIYYKQMKKKGFTQYQISYRINPSRVLKSDVFTKLFDTKEYDKMKKKADKYLTQLCPELPKLKHCSLSRMDYCVDVHLDNQEQVKAFVKLAKRCNIPKSFEEKFLYDKKKRSKDDMTIYNSGVEISLYNKYAQMTKESSKKKNKGLFPDIEEARDVLRIEIRCMTSKLNHLSKKFDVETTGEFMEKTEKIGWYLFDYYLYKMFPKGDCYTLPDAIERAKRNEFSDEAKKEMTEFLEYANEKRSLADASKFFRETYGDDYVKKLLWRFRQIDTSPITFPRELKKVFNAKQIPNPVELVTEFHNIK